MKLDDKWCDLMLYLYALFRYQPGQPMSKMLMCQPYAKIYILENAMQ